MKTSDEILAEVLRLPVEARAALAAKLLDSLDNEVDPDAEEAWAAELQRRALEIDNGTAETLPWHEARRRILAGGDDETPPR